MIKHDYAPRTGSTKTDWFKVAWFSLSTVGIMSLILNMAGVL